MTRDRIITAFVQDLGAVYRLLCQLDRQNTASKSMPTPAQLGILMVVASRGAQSIKELANAVHMSSSAATQLVDGLVKDEFLMRKEHEQDRRKVSISLTTKGKAMLKRMKRKRLSAIGKLFEPLSDRELSQLVDFQRKVLQSIDNR